MAKAAGRAAKPRQPSQALLRLLERLAPELDASVNTAQLRFFEALEAPNQAERLRIVAEALQRNPAAADAWGMLAQASVPGAPLTLHLWRVAAAAGLVALGPFPLEPGEAWGVMESRPYMRARCGLALELRRQGEAAAAIAEVEGMLALNPNDNQGMRYILLAWLLEDGADPAAAALFERYAEDGAAVWAYGAALLAYRRQGPGEAADAARAAAIANNPHVAAALLGRITPRPGAIGYTPGSPEEAAEVVADLLPAWQGTAGALDWLAAGLGPAPAPKRGRRPRAAGDEA